MSTETTSVDHAPRTPSEAWRALQEGNARFISGDKLHPHQDAQRRESLAESQKPFAVIFGCSDSRLAAEIIFDLGLGDAFVIRTAGQVIDNAVLGSLEFAIDVLGTPLIMVLGHDSCGAVTATKNSVESGELPTGFQRDLVERITPSVLQAQRSGNADLQDMVVEHTKQTAARMLDQSTVISGAVSRGEAAVIGVFYHLADGKAELVYSDDPQIS
ncbi:carbonic anhydrase [Glutamicibacter protophormiae]|uniref:Carbonic anhydrase n=1 Tax=Kocuria varians TaxID=1272 RepID=A0A7D7KZI9_KOCVA|nr:MULTISPECIES: carbonic anhydrase [Kocuria]QMS56633.1 Carbonic anhydrase [Kocuria varians]WNB87795.1 carbonic anhydrase [Glutamicibacter protophormiae]